MAVRRRLESACRRRPFLLITIREGGRRRRGKVVLAGSFKRDLRESGRLRKTSGSFLFLTYLMRRPRVVSWEPAEMV